LNYEIEQWATNTNSYVWAQVPLFTNNCWIWAHWGNPSATNQEAYTTNGATWTNGYVIVAHLAETNGTARDSTTNANHGTPSGGVAQNATGVVDGGDQFDGIDDKITFGTTARPTNSFSFEAWIRTTESHEIDAESTSGTLGVNNQKYAFEPTHGGSANGGAGLSIGTNGVSVYEHGDGYMPGTAVYSANIGSNWNHVVVTYQSKQPVIYVNGGLARTGLTSLRTAVIAPYNVGYMSYGGLNGSMDEIRVSNMARSTNWIWAEYMNMGSNDVFNTYGAAQRTGAPTVFVFR
jgi:hypothetical protein